MATRDGGAGPDVGPGAGEEHRPLERVVARDGSSRAVRTWSSARRPWLYLLLVHGLAEHGGRYERVGRWLAQAGVAVHAVDLPGFGSSDGRRGDVDRWEGFHDDLEEWLGTLRLHAERLPIALYGHSTGALIALGYVLSERPKPDMLVLSAPALDAAIPAWKRGLVHLLGGILPSVRLRNDLAGAVLSRDPRVGEDYAVDPLNVHTSTLRLARLAFAEQGRVRARLHELALPTYVVHGGADRVVPPSVSEALSGLSDVTRVVLPGLRHEPHNEPEGESVIAEVVEWLRDQAHSPVGPPTKPAGLG